MAMSMLLLRNAARINLNLVKSAPRLAPLRSYTNLINAQRIGATIKPISQLKNAAPVVRNIATSAPRMSAAGGSHTTIWVLERGLAAVMLALIPAAFIAPSKALDALMAVSIVLHAHWGIDAMITDYVRPLLVGNLVPKIAHGLLLLLSVATLGGLFYIIQNDIGIARSIQKLWAVKGAEHKQSA